MYEIGTATEFSAEVVEELEAELRRLAAESAVLKGDIEVIRDKRRAVNAQMDPLLAERQRLYRMRGVIPGDVIVEGV